MFPSLILFNQDMETRATVTCMIEMMYNEVVMHIVLFHWNRPGSF